MAVHLLLVILVAICAKDITAVFGDNENQRVGAICDLETGGSGTCVPSRRCRSAGNMNRCSSPGNPPLVCCPESSITGRPGVASRRITTPAQRLASSRPSELPTIPSVLTTRPSVLPTRPAEPELEPTIAPSGKTGRYCQTYGETVYRTFDQSDSKEGTKPTCPSAAQQLIVGGHTCVPKEFPHMAALGYGNSTNIAWLAGGSLISDIFVLTAASCIFAKGRGQVRWVYLGELNIIDGSSQSRPQTFEVLAAIPYPEYKGSSHYHDIALLRLKTIRISFSEYVRPACLHTNNFIPVGTIVTATGWGVVDWDSENTSDDLMKVDVKIHTAKRCNDSYAGLITGSKKLVRGFDEETMICAGDPENRRDTCVGDSGGPIQIRLTDPFCMFSIVGVTSFGSRACGETNAPAVYTRVSRYIPWIESIVWPA